MPGYPTSCLTNCYLLLAPMLRRMARLPPAQAHIVEVPLGKRIERSPGRLEFHTVRIVNGQALSAFKESSAITSMAHADGYIEIPADVDRLETGQTVRVAREKKAVVGMALAVYSPSAEEGRLLVLNDFFVDPAWRRKGVGRALATRLLEEAKAMRVERIDLEVTPTNATAAAFWKSMGFRTGGRTPYGRGIL